MQAKLNDLGQIEAQIWHELARSVVDKHHEWRTTVLATMSTQGPEQRTVVLRQCDQASSTLSFYTDVRTPKVAQLRRQPTAMLLFWSKRLSWQLRVRVSTTVLDSDEVVSKVWERVRQSPAAADYLSETVPGQPLVSRTVGVHHHLCVVVCQIHHIDWLELGRSGHRRAAFRLEGNLCTSEWLTP